MLCHSQTKPNSRPVLLNGNSERLCMQPKITRLRDNLKSYCTAENFCYLGSSLLLKTLFLEKMLLTHSMFWETKRKLKAVPKFSPMPSASSLPFSATRYKNSSTARYKLRFPSTQAHVATHSFQTHQHILQPALQVSCPMALGSSLV